MSQAAQPAPQRLSLCETALDEQATFLRRQVVALARMAEAHAAEAASLKATIEKQVKRIGELEEAEARLTAALASRDEAIEARDRDLIQRGRELEALTCRLAILKESGTETQGRSEKKGK